MNVSHGIDDEDGKADGTRDISWEVDYNEPHKHLRGEGGRGGATEGVCVSGDYIFVLFSLSLPSPARDFPAKLIKADESGDYKVQLEGFLNEHWKRLAPGISVEKQFNLEF